MFIKDVSMRLWEDPNTKALTKSKLTSYKETKELLNAYNADYALVKYSRNHKKLLFIFRKSKYNKVNNHLEFDEIETAKKYFTFEEVEEIEISVLF